jgi:hypothetical protein
MHTALYLSPEPTTQSWFAQIFSASICQRQIGLMRSLDGGCNGLIGMFVISARAKRLSEIIKPELLRCLICDTTQLDCKAGCEKAPPPPVKPIMIMMDADQGFGTTRFHMRSYRFVRCFISIRIDEVTI